MIHFSFHFRPWRAPTTLPMQEECSKWTLWFRKTIRSVRRKWSSLRNVRLYVMYSISRAGCSEVEMCSVTYNWDINFSQIYPTHTHSLTHRRQHYNNCTHQLSTLHLSTSVAPQCVLGHRRHLPGHIEGPMVPRTDYEDRHAELASTHVLPRAEWPPRRSGGEHV